MSSSSLSALLQARYGEAALVALTGLISETSPTLDALLSHKSVRAFAPDSLPAGTLETLTAAAQSAASSSNLQAWSMVALQNPERKAEAARLCGDQQFIRDAPLFLVFCADLARLDFVSKRENLPGDALDYFEMFLVAAIDAALAAQNAAVAAEALDLGICYVGAARNHPRELAQFLELPPRVVALFGMAVGVPDASKPAAVKPRLPQPAVLHHETYDGDLSASLETYNDVMGQFYDAQGMKTGGEWTTHSAKRVAGTESLSGRDTLRQTIEELGFGLK